MRSELASVGSHKYVAVQRAHGSLPGFSGCLVGLRGQVLSHLICSQDLVLLDPALNLTGPHSNVQFSTVDEPALPESRRLLAYFLRAQLPCVKQELRRISFYSQRNPR